MIEIDITYNYDNYIEEQVFLIENNKVSVCNYVVNGWGDLKEYTKDTETLVIQILQCLKEGVNFREYGIPRTVKIFNLDKY